MTPFIQATNVRALGPCRLRGPWRSGPSLKSSRCSLGGFCGRISHLQACGRNVDLLHSSLVKVISSKFDNEYLYKPDSKQTEPDNCNPKETIQSTNIETMTRTHLGSTDLSPHSRGQNPCPSSPRSLPPGWIYIPSAHSTPVWSLRSWLGTGCSGPGLQRESLHHVTDVGHAGLLGLLLDVLQRAHLQRGTPGGD